MLGLFLGCSQNGLAVLVQFFQFRFVSVDGLLHLLLLLADVLSLGLPVSLVAYDVLQILVALDIFTAHNLRCIGNHLFGQTNLAGYLYGKRTARIANLQLKESLHLMAVIEHGSVDDTLVVFCKVFQVLVMSSDDSESPSLVESFQDGFGHGTAYLWLCATSEFVDEQQASLVAVAQHVLHVQQVRRVGTQVVLDALFVTDVNEDAAEDACMAPFVYRDGHSALKHVLKQSYCFQTD